MSITRLFEVDKEDIETIESWSDYRYQFKVGDDGFLWIKVK